jgi:hypothetical protein
VVDVDLELAASGATQEQILADYLSSHLMASPQPSGTPPMR